MLEYLDPQGMIHGACRHEARASRAQGYEKLYMSSFSDAGTPVPNIDQDVSLLIFYE